MPVFERAITEIAQCVSSGRDCGGDASVVAAPADWRERLRQRCMDHVTAIDAAFERTGGNVILTCVVGDIRAIYTARYDRGSAGELREPVVRYRYETV
ncbi:hypothetical protein BH09PSE1_BH09PSE1_02380 [soil metagenome]